MQRPCNRCGTVYEARRSTSQYCGANCRAKAAQERSSGLQRPVTVLPSDPEPVSGLVATVSAELVKHGRLDTVPGQQAVFLAGRVTQELSGSAVAALSRELRAVMEVALEGIAREADPMDELKARRDRLRATS